MARGGLSIELLPALHGDAIWIEWGDEGDRHRILIDGGPRATFNTLGERFQQLPSDDRHVDLMVVTHIDLDHIDGATKLLRAEELGVRYDDIWFNDFRHLDPDAKGVVKRGAKQGEYLSAVIESRRLPWNRAFNGGSVVVPEGRPLPKVDLPGGLRLVLVSPTTDKLRSLEKEWKRVLDKAGMTPGDRRDALARLDKTMAPADLSRGGPKLFGTDPSKPNGSSIGFIAEYRGERWLLAGDAHADVLVTNLRRYGKEVREDTLRLDGFKLAHHGSMNNLSVELLQSIDCPRFLVSTNGNRFHHPDEESIDLIVENVERPHLVFNYLTDYTRKWHTKSDAYTSEYLDQPDPRDTEIEEERSSPNIEVGPSPRSDAVTEAPSTQVAPLEDAKERSTLTLTVHHASLDTADFPVLVGHYLATPLSGAEGFIDRRFRRRLSDYLVQGDYPGEIGESQLILPPPRRHPHQGALVVGLGEYGELTPLKLVETVRAALVRHALNEADRRETGEAFDLGICSVPLGASGDHGISIGASVRAIVDGVRRANLSLRTGDDGSCRAQYTTVQIFDRNAPEAELAFRALQIIPDGSDDQLDEVPPPSELLSGEGRLTNSLPVDTQEATWWRVRVSDVTPEPDDGTEPPYLDLEFAVGGRLARVGKIVHRVERRRLERLLEGAVGRPDTTRDLRTTLFELLFPNQLKWDLADAQDVHLEVDDRTADIPWEMLEARNPQSDSRGELALRAKLIRQFKLPDPPSIRRATEPRALVIGNPPTGHLAPNLPGAAAEAEAVANTLDPTRQDPQTHDGYTVKDLIWHGDKPADPDITTEIETALLAHDYRIIHIAAHGFFQPHDPTRTGVAIGPDDFITAEMFGQLDVTPDIVFLNCCHVGSVRFGVESSRIDLSRRNYHRLSASLSRQLIEAGVRAVVVAGWAVSDIGAKAFARTFYQSLLAGHDFSTAVHRGREEAAGPGRTDSTWGAYQCYGDGSYRLPQLSGRPKAEPESPLTRREVLRRLESLVNRIESVGMGGETGDHADQAVDELTVLMTTAGERGWLGKKAGHLCQEFGRAWAAAGDFERAVECYRAALEQSDGKITLEGIEQLANLEGRYAARLARGDKPDHDLIRSLNQQSIRRIEQLEALSGTGERMALRAGHRKREAVASEGEERSRALENAAVAYLGSYKEESTPYTLFNHVQLEVIRHWSTGEAPDPGLRDEVDAQLEQCRKKPPSTRNYWDAVALPDGELTLAIMNDDIENQIEPLATAYLAVFDGRSTARERASTLEHVLDLADLHPDTTQSDALRDLHERLVSSERSGSTASDSTSTEADPGQATAR
jgi:hypothetical protein